MGNDKPAGDLPQQVAAIYRRDVMRTARMSHAVQIVHAVVFGAGLWVTLQTPLIGRWYIAVPVLALLLAVVTGWSLRGSMRLPLGPAAPDPGPDDEDKAVMFARIREHLRWRSKPVNMSDLRDARWWAMTALFFVTGPCVGAWATARLGYLTYGVAASWFYTLTVFGLGYWQSRLVTTGLKKILFADGAEGRDSPE